MIVLHETFTLDKLLAVLKCEKESGVCINFHSDVSVHTPCTFENCEYQKEL